MAKTKSKLDIGFQIFLIFVETIVGGCILVGAWLIDKLLLAPPLVVALRLTRVKIESKYDVFHLASILACMVLSVAVSIIGLYISLPIQISFISNVIVGVGFAIISWHVQEIIEIKRKRSERELLIEKCKALGYNELKTQIAVKFFIDNEKPKDVWKWLCEKTPTPMSWDSLYNLKSKMKKDLF